MTVVVAVDASLISQKCFDMTLRMVKRGDVVKVIHITNSDQRMEQASSSNSLLGDSAISSYYSQECSKACMRIGGCEFEYAEVPLIGRESVSNTILEYTERALADLIILGSVELAKPDGSALGSVSAAVAKKTPAHILIAKHFAQ